MYNLLPEILSNLSSEPDLPQKGFQEVMRHLLQYIGKEKHADSLVDKLCARFESTQEIKQWRNLAFCIAQVSLLPGIGKQAVFCICLSNSVGPYSHSSSTTPSQ